VIKPRTRVVYFRVSQEEYEQLNEVCRRRGDRSLSDFARAAVCHMIEDPGTPLNGIVSRRLDMLDRAISQLNSHLMKMNGEGSEGQ
jgi:hypothetical protein